MMHRALSRIQRRPCRRLGPAAGHQLARGESRLQVNGSASAPSALDAPATSRQSPDDADGLEAARRAGTFRYRAISNLLTVAFVGVQSPLPRRLRSPVRTATNLRAGLC